MSIEAIIKRKIEESLRPQALIIENRSAHHAGHAGDNGTGESHFHLTIVADCFRGLSRVERHRLVNNILSTELKGPIHALALRTISPEEGA